MKVGDVIRLSNGAISSFDLKSDIGMVVGTIPRIDHLPDDWLVLADGIIHAMGHQLSDPDPVINENR